MTASPPGWWWLVDVPDVGRVAGCAPPKCGLTSLQVGLVPGLAELVERFGAADAGRAAFSFAKGAGLGPFTGLEVVENFPALPRYLAVRDPVERFVSCWRDKCDPNLSNHPVFRWVAGLSFPDFLAYVESFPIGNPHWAPQSAFLVPHARLVPFQRFNATLGLPAVRANESRRGNPPDDVAAFTDRLRKLYVRDFDLWESANR